MGSLCVEKSRELAHYYKMQCDLIGCHLLDAGELGVEFNTVDYMHLTNKGHETLAKALAERIPDML
jgi:lysophospholipase L1-like esterase